MSFSPSDIAFVDIFPPVGIARVGDSDQYYIGPEVPGVESFQTTDLRTNSTKSRSRRAARFRVYAFDKDSKVLGEIVEGDAYSLLWIVHVANKKCAWVNFRGRYQEESWKLRNPTRQPWPEGAEKTYAYTDTRDKLIVNSGEQVVLGANADPVSLSGQFYGSQDKPTKVHLGDIRTEDQGRLVVTASNGDSYCIKGDDPHPPLEDKFDNSDWVDSMCDGKVYALVNTKKDPSLSFVPKNKATIICAPPKFAKGTHCPTSLLDLFKDIYEEPARSQPGYDVGTVEYHRHIQPMFDRIYANSWMNPKANEGHGPKKSYVFSRKSHSDPKAPAPAPQNRKDIFDRLRVPVKKDNPQSEAQRQQQATDYYMPRLAGDGGDNPESGEPNDHIADQWASLTQLQYDRLRKWKDGDFITGDPVPSYSSFDSIPLQHQPGALTTAALEWCVGAPLYPGIEMYWVGEFPTTHDLDNKYRISDAINPGDLGKGLSLPWQSDFNMCNTHWWPSTRPDSVVTQPYFDAQNKAFEDKPAQLAANLPQRELWTRNFDPDHAGGNTAMVRKWAQLGFIAKQAYGNDDTLPAIYVEKERTLDDPSVGH